MIDLKQYLKSNAIHLNAREVLQSPIAILLGVSQDAADRLTTLQIRTVFELATAQVFAAASNIAGSTPTNILFSRYGAVPADIIKDSLLDREVSELALQPIEALDGIGTVDGPQIAAALHVQTIRDLAFWPPYVAAVAIVQQVLLPENAPGFDPEAPADLIPTSGDYPTEKVFYSSVVIDEIQDQPTQDLNAPVKIAANDEFGFKTPAIGALITIEQCWYSEGVALGNLLHSLALAPGESTRIATIDWARQTRGQSAEEIAQSESLSNVTGHNRAISEVTSAMAAESQFGSSLVNSASRSKSFGVSARGGFGAFSFGASASFASNRSRVKAVSSSYGRRNLMASMAQNVADQTHQYANAVRNRRASVVTEVSQQEQETLASRTVTNYNHMHALSIQYYEVLQIYRVTSRVSQVEKCLFVPMQVIDDWTQALINRYRDILYEVALEPRVRSALNSLNGTIKLNPTIELSLSLNDPHQLSSAEPFPQNAQLVGLKLSVDNTSPDDGEPVPWIGGWQLKLQDRPRVIGKSSSEYSGDLLVPVSLAAIESIGCWVFLQDNALDDRSIELALEIFNGVEMLHWTLTFTYGSLKNEGGVSSSGKLLAEVVRVVNEGQDPENSDWLVQHLAQNRVYYSQMIWLNMDAATRALLLSPYRYEGAPLMQQIDPEPITVTGNYLAFRMNADEEDPAWRAWLGSHGYFSGNTMRHETVPLPSGGVFAEAVLGRFNSAEKLDMSRFWNWQDSPIPFAAPEIAALQAGQHTVESAPTAGNLDQPIVNIVNPTALPDPQGLNGILNTLGNGNLFRDMSGREQAFALAQAGLQNASQAAIAAGYQAGANMTNAGALLNRAAAIDAAESGGSNGAYPGNGSSGSANSNSNSLQKDLINRLVPTVPPQADNRPEAGSPPEPLPEGNNAASGTTPPVPRNYHGFVPSHDMRVPDSNLLDVSALGPHSYRHNKSVEDKTGLIYTAKVGFLDIGHMRDLCDLTKYVFDRIETNNGEPAEFDTTYGKVKITQAIPKNDWIKVARSVAFDDSVGEEIASYWYRGIENHPSSFSPESLFSSYIGTFLAEQALKLTQANFNNAVTEVLLSLLEYFKAMSKEETLEAFGKISNRWVEYTNPIDAYVNFRYLKRRNFTIQPWQAGHPSDETIPYWIAAPGWIKADFGLTEDYYSYSHGRYVDETPVNRVDFLQKLNEIRADAKKEYGNEFDQP